MPENENPGESLPEVVAAIPEKPKRDPFADIPGEHPKPEGPVKKSKGGRDLIWNGRTGRWQMPIVGGAKVGAGRKPKDWKPEDYDLRKSLASLSEDGVAELRKILNSRKGACKKGKEPAKDGTIISLMELISRHVLPTQVINYVIDDKVFKAFADCLPEVYGDLPDALDRGKLLFDLVDQRLGATGKVG